MNRSHVIDLTKIREDIFTTLAIAALLHETDHGVRDCAKQLIQRAPGSLCKSVLRPLAESDHALEIVINEMAFPTLERVIGSVRRNNYEYELVITYRGIPNYTVEDMVQIVADHFVQRGVVTGRLYMTMIHPQKRRDHTTSVDLDEYSSYKNSVKRVA